MKVKDLIKELENFDQELDVYICDEVEGNNSPVTRAEMGHTGLDFCNKNSVARDVILLRAT